MPVGMSYDKNALKNNGDTKFEKTFEYVRAKIVMGKGAGRVYFLDQTEEGLDGQGQPVQVFRSYKVNREDMPEFPQIPDDKVIEECQVVYDNKESKVVGIGPWNGSFRAKAIDLGPKAPDGTTPLSRNTPKPDKNRPGKTYDDIGFWCIYQITEPASDFVGAKVFNFLKDKFYQRVDGMADILGNLDKTGTHAVRLLEWGTVHGLWNDDIKWPADGNILPELLRRLLEKNIEVLLIVKKGMVSDVLLTSGTVTPPRSVAVFTDNTVVEKTASAPVSAGQADPDFGTK